MTYVLDTIAKVYLRYIPYTYMILIEYISYSRYLNNMVTLPPCRGSIGFQVDIDKNELSLTNFNSKV